LSYCGIWRVLFVNVSVAQDLGKWTSIVFERTEGPTYKVEISRDRKLVYQGFRDVKTKGRVVARITDDQVTSLLTEFRRARVFSLRNSYADLEDGCTSWVSDFPTVSVTLSIGRSKKKIRHYLGCTFGNRKLMRDLKILTRLEKRFDEIINIEQWIGTEEERNNLPDPMMIRKT
jgi:uncharacterized protein DUF6438